MFDNRLPSGWSISARLMAAYKFSDGTTLELSRDGKYLISRGFKVYAEGDDYHPSPYWGDWPMIIDGLLSFMEYDAENYGREPEDGYLFSTELAEWAHRNEAEISMLRHELSGEEEE